MRALWMHYPEDESVFGMDDQFLVGFDLLIKPVVKPGVTSLPVYLPGGKTQRWYDVKSTKNLLAVVSIQQLLSSVYQCISAVLALFQGKCV